MLAHSATNTAVETIWRPITVAAGVFAPGHLGELTRIIDFDMADAVLEDTGKQQRRLRALPSRVGLYFVLAMALFPGHGYQGVWAKLTGALGQVAQPTAKALRDVRRRLGPGPLRRLFGLLAGPTASRRTPGVTYGGYRRVSFDGCRSIKVPCLAGAFGSGRVVIRCARSTEIQCPRCAAITHPVVTHVLPKGPSIHPRQCR